MRDGDRWREASSPVKTEFSPDGVRFGVRADPRANAAEVFRRFKDDGKTPEAHAFGLSIRSARRRPVANGTNRNEPPLLKPVHSNDQPGDRCH